MTSLAWLRSMVGAPPIVGAVPRFFLNTWNANVDSLDSSPHVLRFALRSCFALRPAPAATGGQPSRESPPVTALRRICSLSVRSRRKDQPSGGHGAR